MYIENQPMARPRGTGATRCEYIDPMGSQQKLRVVQTVVLALVLLIVGVQKRNHLWPVYAWDVYDRINPSVPGPSTSRMEIRAITQSGSTTVLLTTDLLEASRANLARRSIREAARGDAPSRAYLARLAAAHVQDLATVEVWEVTWAVDAGKVPPLRFDQPGQERLVAKWPAQGSSS